MVNRANSFGRGINVEGEGGFGERLDNFIEFQAGNLPGVLKMNKPQVTANAPTMGEVTLNLIELHGYDYNCTVVYRLWEL